MNSPFGFIVKPEDGLLYKTESSSSSNGLDISTSIDDGKSTNRFGIVVSVPTWYNGAISDGDRIILHHNVFRKFNNYNGSEVFSHEFVGDGNYLVLMDQIFGYFKDGLLTTTSDNIFVKPTIGNVGVVSFCNNDVPVNVGEEIVFTSDCEYVFHISGETYYKMKFNDICMKR
jgi:hypothetical protein